MTKFAGILEEVGGSARPHPHLRKILSTVSVILAESRDVNRCDGLVDLENVVIVADANHQGEVLAGEVEIGPREFDLLLGGDQGVRFLDIVAGAKGLDNVDYNEDSSEFADDGVGELGFVEVNGQGEAENIEEGEVVDKAVYHG